MVLEDGITGFFQQAVKSCVYMELKKSFQQFCYELANINHGKVFYIEDSLNSKNFYFAKLELYFTKIFVLANARYPYLAFASLLEYEKIEFINKSLDWKLPLFLKYTILNVEELNIKYCDKEVENHLNNAEIKQVLYWKPTTVGEVIFNFWD